MLFHSCAVMQLYVKWLPWQKKRSKNTVTNIRRSWTIVLVIKNGKTIKSGVVNRLRQAQWDGWECEVRVMRVVTEKQFTQTVWKERGHKNNNSISPCQREKMVKTHSTILTRNDWQICRRGGKAEGKWRDTLWSFDQSELKNTNPLKQSDVTFWQLQFKISTAWNRPSFLSGESRMSPKCGVWRSKKRIIPDVWLLNLEVEVSNVVLEYMKQFEVSRFSPDKYSQPLQQHHFIQSRSVVQIHAVIGTEHARLTPRWSEMDLWPLAQTTGVRGAYFGPE